jgi:hypothetical protein
VREENGIARTERHFAGIVARILEGHVDVRELGVIDCGREGLQIHPVWDVGDDLGLREGHGAPRAKQQDDEVGVYNFLIKSVALRASERPPLPRGGEGAGSACRPRKTDHLKLEWSVRQDAGSTDKSLG